MSVFMMVSQNDVGAVESKSYPGNWVREEYAGMVIGLRESNGYDDSDFYARVWDEATQSVMEVMYASTRFWCAPAHAKIDASPEVLAKVRAHIDAQAAARKRQQEALADQLVALKGTVRILAAAGRRKHLKGQSGVVFWMCANKFKYGEVSMSGTEVLEAYHRA